MVPLGSGSHNVDQQVSPGHGGCEAGVAGARGDAPRQWLHRKGRGNGPGLVRCLAASSRQLDVPSNRIDQLISGKRAMTADTALRLEQWLCVEAAFWMNPQNSYELDLATEK